MNVSNSSPSLSPSLSLSLSLSLPLSLLFLSQGCRTLLATHFHELTETLSNEHDKIGSYHTVAQSYSNGEIILTYKIEVRESGGAKNALKINVK